MAYQTKLFEQTLPCIIMPIHAQVNFCYPIKALANQRDLALAYSPGVAIPCLEIEKTPKSRALYRS